MPTNQNKRESQIVKLMNKDSINVVIVKNKAYWVHENVFYCSRVLKDGTIDTDNAKPVDVFSMSKKQAEGLLKILDSLSEK